MTPLEVEDILSAVGNFRLNRECVTRTDEMVFEALRANLRPTLTKSKIVDAPETVNEMKRALREKFLCSLVTPGINEGSRAASSNSEPITQQKLKAAQSAGVKNTGNPIGELLSVSATRVAEYVFTAKSTIHPPPEWYLYASDIATKQMSDMRPPSMDDLLAEAMNITSPPIEPLIIRTESNSICRTVKFLADPSVPLPNIFKALPTTPIPGKSYVFHTVRFSISEALKLRRTPFSILAVVQEYLNSDLDGFKGTLGSDGETRLPICFANITDITPTHFDISIWSNNGTVSLSAAHGLATLDTGNGEHGISSFEIIQIPTMKCVTAIEELESSEMGLLCPTRSVDGKPSRIWLFHLLNPIISVPVKHLCLLLVKLGFKIIGCERNAVGRCIMLRIAENHRVVDVDEKVKLYVWIAREAERLASSSSSSSSLPDNSQESNKNITTWRSSSEDQMQAYVMYRSIKYRTASTKTSKKTKTDQASGGDPKALGPCYRFMSNPTYDWYQTYTNVIPAMVNVACTTTASQVMEIEWVQAVAGGKVSQSGLEHVTMYSCRRGPLAQPVTQTAIRAGGPLAALNENPIAVFTTASLRNKIYTTSGSQSEIVIGATSKHVGASSVTVKAIEEYKQDQLRLVQNHQKSAITIDTSVKLTNSTSAGPDDMPGFLL
jgi:hypothetical protein